MAVTFKVPKIHHLIRYFLLFGILAFSGYLSAWNDRLTFSFMGPPIYLAYGIKNAINNIFEFQTNDIVNKFVFLAPITLLYYGLIGYQLKQLWNEHGLIRTISLLALITFVFYIHYWSWNNLMAYLSSNG